MLRTEKTHDLEAFSECSGGCQSGWTLYLGHSQTSPIKDTSAHEEEEDLSMLSDASSGPPNIKQDDYFDVCYSSNDGDDDFPTSFSGNRAKRKRRTEKELNQKQNREEEHNLLLEDTASCSPPLCFSKNSSNKKLTVEDTLELSGGFSANHFEVCGQEGGENQL